jgi:hypothetical protein
VFVGAFFRVRGCIFRVRACGTSVARDTDRPLSLYLTHSLSLFGASLARDADRPYSTASRLQYTCSVNIFNYVLVFNIFLLSFIVIIVAAAAAVVVAVVIV